MKTPSEVLARLRPTQLIVFATLNLPGQDVKAGRPLLRRPARYRSTARLLNRLGVNVAVFQEITHEGFTELVSGPRWAGHRATPNEDKWGQVGNAVAWRSDVFKKLDAGELRMPWSGATKGALFIPWVRLEPHGKGSSFMVYGVHWPAGGRYAGTTDVRKAMYKRLKAKLSGNWLVGGDRNGFENLGVGRHVARHNVDALDASGSFKAKGRRIVVKGVMWVLGDHPLVMVRGRFRARKP